MQSVSHQQLRVLPDDAVLLPDFHLTPSQLAKCWSSDTPLMVLIASCSHSNWSRWSVIAPATGERLTCDSSEALTLLSSSIEQKGNITLLPNWIGFASYELGYLVEPSVGELKESAWPLIDMMWCDKALVHDNQTNQWWSIGGLQPPEEIELPFHQACQSSALKDPLGDNSFLDAVEKTIEYIHAGDIFQANITRRFSSSVSGNIRQSALDMLNDPGGWFGAWFEFPSDGRFLLSMSPELFLRVDGESRSILTRPMKGTRAAGDDPATLLHSEKDAAELHMIVDLMRNDLGRVCEFGSMQVCDARSLEPHPTVWQCVGEVQGIIREELSNGDVLRATFPAGSITGAPKVRAMQIIHELESTARGPYCGAIGIFGKSMMLSVGIRTAMFDGSGTADSFEGSMQYSTGCGIVADSQPEEELHESEVKAHIMHFFSTQL